MLNRRKLVALRQWVCPQVKTADISEGAGGESRRLFYCVGVFPNGKSTWNTAAALRMEQKRDDPFLSE